MDSLAPTTDMKADALARRYGADALPAAGPWNETIAVMLDHRSVRGYKPDPLPAGTLESMIAAAQSAATSSNMQWWSAIAITDPAKKKVLAEIAGNQKHIEQCPLFIAWVADMSRNQRISDATKTDFETMPWLETFMVACIDAALAAQNAVVAAQSIGLSTVYIGAMRNDPIKVAELLGLPPQSFVVFGLCVGYAADGKAQGEVKPRLPQSIVLHRERYDAAQEAARRVPYDAEMTKFSARHELQAATWTQRVLNRLGPIKSMNGRETIRASLKKLGFEIR
ncbi:MAG: nitroreductase family protein [Reyranella sp.]|nr:nitroreductase family protein [Reyranella sp.]MDP3162053.1 nitroreductase family protein [Reyranella sp.]